MRWQTILLAFTIFVILTPLSAVYFYRAYTESAKRIPKILKGFNYTFFAILMAHGIWSTITLQEFASFMVIGIALLGVMELSYHIDVILDIKELIGTRLSSD